MVSKLYLEKECFVSTLVWFCFRSGVFHCVAYTAVEHGIYLPHSLSATITVNYSV